MPWNQPKSAWQWLLLIAPGVLSVAMTAFGKVALSRQDEIGPSILSIPIAILLCVALGCHLARGAGSVPRFIGVALLSTIALVVVNLAISFAGCAVMQPHFSIQ